MPAPEGWRCIPGFRLAAWAESVLCPSNSVAPAAAPTLLTNSRRLVVESLLNMISSMKKMHSLDLLERAAGRVRPVTHIYFSLHDDCSGQRTDTRSHLTFPG